MLWSLVVNLRKENCNSFIPVIFQNCIVSQSIDVDVDVVAVGGGGGGVVVIL